MSASPILKAFERQIIPWVEQFGVSKIAFAQPTWRAWQTMQVDAPDDIRGAPTPLLGKRKALRGKRSHGNVSLKDSYWPEDHLHSFRALLHEYLYSVISTAVRNERSGEILS